MNFYEEEQRLDPVLERAVLKSNAESTHATEMYKKGRRKVGISEEWTKDFKNKSALMEASKKQRELNTNASKWI